MYEFRDEATRALTPKSARPVKEGTAPVSRALKHLAVSRPASVTHVQFKKSQIFGPETMKDLREDFAQLADWLVRDSQVLLDFAGVMSFSAASIAALAVFKRKLKIKGSRIALCCLDPAVHQSFYERSNELE